MKLIVRQLKRGSPSKLISILVLVGLFGPMSSAYAELENQLEPEYAEAVLEYNAKNLDGALKLLTELQKRAPQAEEILELKAITLKALKNEKEAATVYRDLIQIKTKGGKDKKEIAPYAFELGMIRYGEQNWKPAEQYLSFSARNGFNRELSQFYLGLIQIQTQNWSNAEINFTSVIDSGLEEIKPAARYYRAQVNFKLGYTSNGFSDLIQAKKSSQQIIDRPGVEPESKRMAEQVHQAANATLGPFDKAQTFGSFSFLLGYDSNVLLLPSEVGTGTGASGKSTLKSMLSAGYGYASSPLKKIQYVPSIRFNFNKNFNELSATGEFADTTLSLYLTKDALAPVSAGLKLEGTFVFQNQTDATGSKKFHFFDNSTLFQPYLKWDASKRWTYLAEFGYRMINYNGEETVSLASKRSGNGIIARLSAQNRAGRVYFNPTYALRVEQNSTEGTEFDNLLLGAQIINTMRLAKLSFSQVVTFDRTTYGNSTTDRKDTLLTLSLLASKKIGPRWAVLVTGNVSKNTSSDSASFSYDRFSLNAGFGYSF